MCSRESRRISGASFHTLYHRPPLSVGLPRPRVRPAWHLSWLEMLRGISAESRCRKEAACCGLALHGDGRRSCTPHSGLTTSQNMPRNCKRRRRSGLFFRQSLHEITRVLLASHREGITVEQLQERMKEQEKAKRKEKLATPLPFQNTATSTGSSAQSGTPDAQAPPAPSAPRKDSSPVKVYCHFSPFVSISI